MANKRFNFKGLKATRDDFFASLSSDYVLVNVVIGIDTFLFDVKSIKKVSGYSDFWRVEGYVDGCEAVLFVDYIPPEGDTEGGFGYLEVI